MTEFFKPGTLSSDLNLPPKILVIGESEIVTPVDLVMADFCFGPTSSHPSSTEAADPAVGDLSSALISL